MKIEEIMSFNSEEFLDAAYKILFDRNIDASGRAHYLSELASGKNRIDVLFDMSRSGEYVANDDVGRHLKKIFRRNGNVGVPLLRDLRWYKTTHNIIASTMYNNFSNTENKILHEKNDVRESQSDHNAVNIDNENKNEGRMLYLKKGKSFEVEPLVSIIIVNFNGEHHLSSLFSSIKSQEYLRYEVIFVDNGSLDNSVEITKCAFPEAKVIALKNNYGFAEGNNIGEEKALGELLLLVNNDMRFGSDFIKKLVEPYMSEEGNDIAAVSPKILYYKPFVKVSIQVNGKCELDFNGTLNFLKDYKKIIITGNEVDKNGASNLELLIASGDNPNQIRLRFKEIRTTNDEFKIFVNNESRRSTHERRNDGTHILTIESHSDDYQYYINNAGSYITSTGEAGDVGFNEKNDGRYDTERNIDAFCGGAVLIRRDSLGNYPLFCPDFFAYYEDSELSVRLRSGGWRLYYTPKALVYHKHASTSNDKSDLFKRLITRNRLYFQAIHFSNLFEKSFDEERNKWNHWERNNNEHTFPDPVFREFIKALPEVELDITSFANRVNHGLAFIRRNLFKKIGIYNLYWNTFGGGELRALYLAQALEVYGAVDLISEQPFDLDKLRSYYNLPLKNCRSVIVNYFSSSDTAAYDLFVNTTHHSNLVSMASNSLCLLSFPHKHATKEFLFSYDLYLANSKFTKDWSHRYWGSYPNVDVLYPSVQFPAQEIDGITKKDKIIVSIGRFFPDDHSKRQLEMVRVFKRMKGRIQDWKLVLIGSVNYADPNCESYVNEVAREANGTNIELLVNSSRESLNGYLDKSAIYWHATGLNQTDNNPEKMEHFGMAIVEAMSHGCIPVCYAGGGIPEILTNSFEHNLFHTENELIDITNNLINVFETDHTTFTEYTETAYKESRKFGLESHNQRVNKLLKRVGFPEINSE